MDSRLWDSASTVWERASSLSWPKVSTARTPHGGDLRNPEASEASGWPTASGNEDNQIVIPQYDVTPTIDIDYTRLRIPTAYKVVNGFAVVRDYEPLIDVEWDDARQCVEAEARWLARAAQASTATEFDQILASAAEQESPDDFDWLFRYLDVGVAGITLVLSAALYATCFSCRVHPGIVGDHVPQVIMAAEPQRVRVLASYAAGADCGVEKHGGRPGLRLRRLRGSHPFPGRDDARRPSRTGRAPAATVASTRTGVPRPRRP